MIVQAYHSDQNTSTETCPIQCQAKTRPIGKCEAVVGRKTNMCPAFLFKLQAKLNFTSNTEVTAALRDANQRAILQGNETLQTILHQSFQEHSFLCIFSHRKNLFGKWNLCAL